MKAAKKRRAINHEARPPATQKIPCVLRRTKRVCWKRHLSIAVLALFALLIAATFAPFDQGSATAEEKPNEPFDIVLSGTGPEEIAEDDPPLPGKTASGRLKVSVEGENENLDGPASKAQEQAIKAQEYLSKGDLKRAIQLGERAVALTPKNALYRFQLAIMRDRNNEKEKALELYREVIEAYDEDPKTLPPSVNIEGIRERMAYLADR